MLVNILFFRYRVSLLFVDVVIGGGGGGGEEEEGGFFSSKSFPLNENLLLWAGIVFVDGEGSRFLFNIFPLLFGSLYSQASGRTGGLNPC